MSRNTYPTITDRTQHDFECSGRGAHNIPKICGYYGRACCCMNSKADRANCAGCPLAEYAREHETAEHEQTPADSGALSTTEQTDSNTLITNYPPYRNGLHIITAERWSFADVRRVCINNDFYTCGDNAEYNALAEFIDNNPPTLKNIYAAAQDIAQHSDLSRYGYNNTDPEAVAGVMFEINRIITKTFEIREATA